MTDENYEAEETVNLPDSFDYATEADLPTKQKFSTTRKAGYVEDEVDVWVKNSIEHMTGFLNRFNEIAYAYNLLKAEHQTTLDNVDATVAVAVQSAVAEALANQPQAENNTVSSDEGVVATPVTADVSETASADVEQLRAENERIVADLHAQYQEREAQLQAHYEGEVQRLVAEATANATTVVATPTQQHTRLFDEAAAQARLHVEQTEARMAAIEREAQEAADAKVAQATSEAEALLNQASLDAQRYRDEANEAIERKNTAVDDLHTIFARTKALYQSQIDSLDEEAGTLGYTPVLTTETVVAFSAVTAEEATVEDSTPAVDEDAEVNGVSETAVEDVETQAIDLPYGEAEVPAETGAVEEVEISGESVSDVEGDWPPASDDEEATETDN